MSDIEAFPIPTVLSGALALKNTAAFADLDPDVEPGLAATSTFAPPIAAAPRVLPDQWTDLRVPLNAVKVGPMNPPTFTQWRNDGAGSTGVFGQVFSATQLQQVYFDVQMPHAYKEGSPLGPHCHFVPLTVPTVGQFVRFGLEWTYASAGQVFPTTTIVTADYTFGADDAQFRHSVRSVGSPIEIPDLKVSAMLSCRFFRDAPNDTYTGTVAVLEFDFHYLVESFGSLNEFTKP